MPWVNGDYKLRTPLGGINHAIVRVDDDLISLRYLKFLDSEADAEHAMSWDEKGDDSLMITFRGETAEAKISEDKMTITGGPGSLAWGDMTWISPEEAAVIRNRPKQPVDAPTVPYPLNPGKYRILNTNTKYTPNQESRASLSSSLAHQAPASRRLLGRLPGEKVGFTTSAMASSLDSTPTCLLTRARWMLVVTIPP